MRSDETRRRAWPALGLSVLFVAAAAALRAGPLEHLGARAIYVTFYPAVVIASLYGGIYPGLLAAFLSAAVASYWLEPVGKLFVITHPSDWLAMIVFLIGCAMIALVCEAMRRARARAIRAETQVRLAEERQRAEKALREAYDRLNLHVDNSPLAVIEWDSDFRITRWAGEARKVFEWTADEVLGKRIDELPWVYPDDLKSVTNVMDGMISGERPTNVNSNRNVTKSGNIIHCEWYNTSIRDSSGKLVSVLSQVLDVSERKRMEERLHKAKDELEERVRERTADLSRAVSLLREEVAQRTSAELSLRERSDQLHRLAAELTLVEQRERQRLAHVLHDGLQQILVGAKFRLALLSRSENLDLATREVSDLLDDAIATSRSLTAELSPPILRQGGLDQALEWLARLMYDKHGLTVNLSLQGKFESVPDEVILMLFQGTRELLFNVAKHAGVKEVRVCAGLSEGQIRIVVQDDGAGFDASLPRSPAKGSSGFGLFSIRERLFLLGGYMKIESAPGRGCRIELVAPQTISASREEVTPQPALGSAPSASPPAHEAAGACGARLIRVFLVDDHQVMRQGLAALLRTAPDMELAGEASNGASALDRIREILPDVVILDISMPEMDGIRAARIIHGEFPAIRIIGLSMLGEDEQAAMLRAGAVACLSKSGPAEAIIAAVRAGVAGQAKAGDTDKHGLMRCDVSTGQKANREDPKDREEFLHQT